MMNASSLSSVPLFDLILCLAQAVDLVSPLVADHHKRTAQLAYGLGLELGLPENELVDLVTAAILHDIGGLTRLERLEALSFEYKNAYGHAVMGYLFLDSFSPLKSAAEIVRFHHVPWKNGAGAVFDGVPVPTASHLLQLADRIAVQIDPQGDILTQSGKIVGRIRRQSGRRFVPEYVKLLESLKSKEAFWLDAIYLNDLNYLGRRLEWQEVKINQEEFLGLTDLFRRIIDFRSQFTATHSAGVAAVATRLASLCSFSEAECWLMHLAGLLHDLGKLAVPAEILEKPAKLTKEEFDIVRRHTYFTFHILEPLKILDLVRIWGAFHHERLDGAGYPFHIKKNELPLGSRIMAVADIFTALTEDRPYRKGIPTGAAIKILEDASAHNRIDHTIVRILQDHLEDINAIRQEAQSSAAQEYKIFIQTAKELSHQE